jgi:hypothetical protein
MISKPSMPPIPSSTLPFMELSLTNLLIDSHSSYES